MPMVLEADERPPPTAEDSVIVTAEELEASLEDERPQVINFGATVWHLVTKGDVEREVRELDRGGRPVFQEVDTSIYCYKLVCSKCGRVRFARRNSIYEIQYCRVCTKQNRLRNRAAEQYRQRARSGRRKRLAPHEKDRIIALVEGGMSQKDAAAELKVTPSAVSKVIARRRARTGSG